MFDISRLVERNRAAVRTAVTGALALAGWAVGYAPGAAAASAALYVLAAVVGGSDVAKKAYYTLRTRTVGINTLVTLAAVGAILVGEYWEAAAVVFLFSLGGFLESRTMRKTRTALQELLELAPDTATVRRDGELREVPAREVAAGEVVLVRPGEKLPVDGVVLDPDTGDAPETPRASDEPRSTVNQAPVTGESAPVPKRPGDEVYAGTVNQAGALEVRATGTGTDTTIQRIIRRVEEAQEATAPTQTLIERFAKYYTPAIVVLAAGAYLVTRNELMALTLLVIGCPGALVIGPPVSIVSAVGSAARRGVLLKGGEHLERAGKVDLVAFDKTGTLTRGETAVTAVESVAGERESSVLRLAAAAEKLSEHHLAGAILAAARGDAERSLATDGGAAVGDGRERSVPDPTDFEVRPGRGVVATVEGHRVLVGNRTLLESASVPVPDRVAEFVRDREDAGETAVHVARDGAVVGAIALRDAVRENAAAVVADLGAAGVETAMLTGDNERTARAVADAVGVDDVRADLLPEEKQAAVREYMARGRVVAMVGDGINDAPSLATADVGIAMGAAGTDTAIETADVALMADDLDRIPDAVRLSKATRRNVIENVAIAVLTVAVLLAGVLTDQVHLAGGMLVHEGSVLLVILNGMRLLRY